MKISNSKKQLAKIINDRCGWRENARWAVQHWNGNVVFTECNKPKWSTFGAGWDVDGDFLIGCHHEKLKHWHQTILSRDEYFHLYPAQDADGWIEWRGGECPVSEDAIVDVEFHFGSIVEARPAKSLLWDIPIRCHGSDIKSYRIHKPKQSIERLCADVTAQNKHTNVDVTTTIEQLAAEYRNAKDFADRKQQEADAAKADADAKLAELVAAGKANGLVLSVAGVEPELVITDWRDLRVGDEIEYLDGGVKHKIGMIGAVDKFDHNSCTDRFFRINDGYDLGWPTKWRFIRRP